MTQTKSVAVVVGSVRKASFSRRLGQALISVAPDNLSLAFVEIGDLPIYNQDLDDEGAPPAAWTAFRQAVAGKDAVLFVTPEYNRSVPALLKNAIDVGSRPYGKSVWAGKPAAVVSNTPGVLGAFGANHHLRQSLVFLDMPAMQQPEAYIAQVMKTVNEAGEPADDNARKFLTGFMAAFGQWVATHTA